MAIHTVALYERVSTLSQSIEMQQLDLRRHCKARAWQITKEYIDEGFSGAREKRPALDELMRDARKRKFDAIVCWRFDRFARSTKHLITALEEFGHLGIEFISYQENIDTSSPLGKALFTIVASIAELERSITVERIRGGLRKARAIGKIIGRPARVIDGDDIRQKRAAGQSLRQIACSLGMSVSLVHRTLKATREAPPCDS